VQKIRKLSQAETETELRFNVQLNTKYVISEMLFPANLLASTEKIKIETGRKKS